ncbi:hypothetical protein CDQ92_20685 [Sphingopyxis bauzanensis]|uniref:Response regulatory domain-containing protein n=1 Tax=Sphingopyxis bauzanensis TaxID=651663 RepID=A0A2D0AMD2_9SPHN|nr:hypothetical protein CDQ92_20685 [Sphingopyxis bauzanensis]
MYKRQGLDCVAYDGALAFLSDLPHRRFACLVTDIRMPGMNGLELIERLHSAGSTLPVVVLTSVRDARMRDRALALGTFDWLMKPVTDHRLLQVLGSAIGTDAVSYTHLDVYKRQSLQRSRR